MLHRDLVLFHEVANLWVYSLDFPSFRGPSPGGTFSLWQGFPFSLSSRVSLMFGQVTSFLVADEALAVPHVLRSFTGREIDFVYIHGIRISGRSGVSGALSWQDVTISSASEFPELYHVPVELSHLIKPLFPFPTSLFLSIREGCGSHHDS